jgi:hypothetical protein
VLQQGYWTDTDVDDIGYAWRYLVGKYQSLAFTWCGFRIFFRMLAMVSRLLLVVPIIVDQA